MKEANDAHVETFRYWKSVGSNRCEAPVPSGLSGNLERSQVEFIHVISRRLDDAGKNRFRKTLPDRDIFRLDGQPAEREEIAAGFADTSDLLPTYLVNLGVEHERRLQVRPLA